MTLSAGTRLGPYEILSPLGAGGMGEVYKARDTRLGREVAIKVLAEHLSSPEARQRFEREARTISQLSHPHICALYDVGEATVIASEAKQSIPGSDRHGLSGLAMTGAPAEGTRVQFLVMEYIEGETLSDRLARGALPLADTLRHGIEIAEALDRAHRAGIVHRDLKPGNVMLTKSGVKLLDFGLAKLREAEGPPGSLSAMPTVERSLTAEGSIVGTLQYMAPEQLEGKATDARTDIFAFGAVLYEMATGKKAFSGTSQASLISAIMTSEPPAVSAVQPTTPPSLNRLVRTCLAKEPDDRWQTARDVELQLAAIAEDAPARDMAGGASRPLRTRWLPWLVAGAALVMAAVATLRKGSPPAQSRPTIRFSVPPPTNGAFAYFVETSFIAVSPDGSSLAYIASDPQGGKRIFLRPLSAAEARAVPGTEGANSLFFSPEGRSIAFFAEGKLKRVELSGGAAVSICDLPLVGPYWSGTWGGADILFSAETRGWGIFRVSAAGGVPAEIIRVDLPRGEARIGWPWFLPDGKRFLYLLRHLDGRGDLMLAEPGKRPRLVMAMQSAVQYVDPGFLVFARDGALLAQRFDPESGRLTGEPFSIAERVRYFASTGSASFAVSRTGTLAYQSRQDASRLAWFDRSGRELETVSSPGYYLSVSISPDGRRALFDRARPGVWTWDVWSLDLERGTEAPVTSGPETEAYPIWLPGEGSIAFSIDRGTEPQLFRKDLATEKEEKLVSGAGFFQWAQDVSPDGRSLVYTQASEHGWFDIWTLSLIGGGKPAAFLRAPFEKKRARFSPDGRYLAMITTESGQLEAYVTPYPGPGERIRVSTGGARTLRWSRDGELLFVSGDNRMMAVPIRTAPSLQIGAPRELFALKGKWPWLDFDVSLDGKRFLAIVPEVVADELPLNVVVNSTSEFSKR
jgi:eukaryotic-like serine/threonine-protein kinase